MANATKHTDADTKIHRKKTKRVNSIHKSCLYVFSAVFLLAGRAQAVLNDLGNGLVDDTSLNMMWLADANMVKTSCNANDELWQVFDPTAVANNSGRTKDEICTNWNGKLNWHEANAWIAILNAQNYLGYSDWRQPATTLVNADVFDYSYAYDGSTDWGYNISTPGTVYAGNTSSELAHLHYNSLGNSAWYNVSGTIQQTDACPKPNYCVQNAWPFVNIQSNAYWSGTAYAAPSSTLAWYFFVGDGFQGLGNQSNFGELFVWPVRSRETTIPKASQPIPGLNGWGLLLMGLVLLGLVQQRIRLFE